MSLMLAPFILLAALLPSVYDVKVELEPSGVTIWRLTGRQVIPWHEIDHIRGVERVQSQGLGTSARYVALDLKAAVEGPKSALSIWLNRSGTVDLHATAMLKTGAAKRLVEAFRDYASLNRIPCDLPSAYRSPLWHPNW